MQHRIGFCAFVKTDKKMPLTMHSCQPRPSPTRKAGARAGLTGVPPLVATKNKKIKSHNLKNWSSVSSEKVNLTTPCKQMSCSLLFMRAILLVQGNQIKKS